MAHIVNASLSWTGPDRDVLRLLVLDPKMLGWEAEHFDEWGEAVLLREIDEHEELTGRVVGVEIVGFLEFNGWTDLPELDVLWLLPGWEPLPLDELLRRKQEELRQQVLVPSQQDRASS